MWYNKLKVVVIMEREKLIPVILGTDVGAYSIARTMHNFYGVRSIIVGKSKYWMTSCSKITTPLVVDPYSEENLIALLMKLPVGINDEKFILFGCSEDYVDIIIRHKKELSKFYIIPTVDEDVLNKVVVKEEFYKICEKVDIKYPKTVILKKNNYKKIKIPFSYPIIAKASNKSKYQRINFEGKMKVFLLSSYNDLIAMLDNCYQTSYDDDFVIQEYIKGPDSNMRVLTCFCDKNSDILFSSVGKILLEEKGPEVSGNYSCIVNDEDDAIVDAATKFLKETKYVGYANFDIKYDADTGDFYFFEVNVRLGRSNFYMGSGDTNYLAPLVDSFVFKKKSTYLQKGTELYRIIPFCLIKKYVKDKSLVKSVKKLKQNNPLDYKNDFSLKRKMYIYLALINHIRKFKKYYE